MSVKTPRMNFPHQTTKEVPVIIRWQTFSRFNYFPSIGLPRQLGKSVVLNK